MNRSIQDVKTMQLQDQDCYEYYNTQILLLITPLIGRIFCNRNPVF